MGGSMHAFLRLLTISALNLSGFALAHICCFQYIGEPDMYTVVFSENCKYYEVTEQLAKEYYPFSSDPGHGHNWNYQWIVTDWGGPFPLGPPYCEFGITESNS